MWLLINVNNNSDRYISHHLFKCCFGKFGTASGFPTNPPWSAIKYAKWRRLWVSTNTSVNDPLTSKDT